jgi:transposase
MPSPLRLYPTDLTDAEWAILEPLIPVPKPGGRPPKWTRRLALAVSWTTSQTASIGISGL